jgi:hypothetical protein
MAAKERRERKDLEEVVDGTPSAAKHEILEYED